MAKKRSRAAHTLKGVCLNLGFDELYEASAEITEKLRGKETAGSEDMFQKVERKIPEDSQRNQRFRVILLCRRQRETPSENNPYL